MNLKQCALLVGMLAVAMPSVAGDPLAIGSKRELFVDSYLIESLDGGARLQLAEPIDAGAVLRFNDSWDGLFAGYGTVIRDGDLYRLYYRGHPDSSRDGSDSETFCYAESKDGIHWTKPRLGLFEVNGTRENNVVLSGAAPVTHNLCPFLDTNPNAKPEERFKAVGGTAPGGLFGYASPDGIHWKRMQEEALFKDTGGVFDSQNVPFWSETEGCYVLYYRKGQKGIRAVARTTSTDFRNWSEPVPMEYTDTGSAVPSHHLYTNQTHAYFRAPHIYIATAARFMPKRQVITDEQAQQIGVHPGYFKDTSDAILMSSRGGNVYDRTFLDGFLTPGVGARNWVSRTNYPVLNVVQTGPAEMSMYVNQDYGQPTAHLHRYTLRLDGFSSLHAPFAGGGMVTKPLTFTGDTLFVNFATSAAGGLRFELQTADGQPIPGFTLADSVEVIGNEIERAVSWKGNPSLKEWQGKPVRLKVEMKDADLFALQFRDGEAGRP